jgi:hypothetical protein
MNVTWVAVLGLVVGLLPGMAQGTIDIDVTFSAGATPTDFGLSDIGAQAQVDTAAGVWNASYSGGTHFWRRNNSGFTDPIVGPVIHGEAEVLIRTFSSGPNHTLMHLQRGSEYSFEFDAVNGAVTLNNAENGELAVINVNNNDGAEHTYGWDLDVTTQSLRLYFDGSQIGPSSYSVPTTRTNHANYLGKGTGSGAIDSVWDRWTVQEGPLPEPGTLSLLAAGAALLISRRRRA